MAESDLAAVRDGMQQAVAGLRRGGAGDGSGTLNALDGADVDDANLRALTGLGLDALMAELHAALARLQQVRFLTALWLIFHRKKTPCAAANRARRGEASHGGIERRSGAGSIAAKGCRGGAGGVAAARGHA